MGLELTTDTDHEPDELPLRHAACFEFEISNTTGLPIDR